MKLQIIIGTTRPNRVTPRVAKWIANTAKEMPEVQVEILDLEDYKIPWLDEPISPRYNPDRHINKEAGRWVEKLNQADAYIFVTPEYNHSFSGVLKNAIDYITFELVKKPASIVGHGTVGGARATMQLKEVLSESQASVIPKQVALLGRVNELIDENGIFNKDSAESYGGILMALNKMLEELKWYSDALSKARNKD